MKPPKIIPNYNQNLTNLAASSQLRFTIHDSPTAILAKLGYPLPKCYFDKKLISIMSLSEIGIHLFRFHGVAYAVKILVRAGLVLLSSLDKIQNMFHHSRNLGDLPRQGPIPRYRLHSAWLLHCIGCHR